ncbi:MAG: transcriptional repressor [Treponema sp.]|nr:transcriptional repressor [Treponema sp.]
MTENYYTRLAETGIRPSIQRVAIYEYLCEHHTHPTVDMMYEALSPSYPTLSRTTIYNTLKLFSDNGLIQTIQIEEDKLRFDADITPHLHFKCIKCGQIYDIFNTNNLQTINSSCCSLLPTDFIAQKIQTNMWGICSNCSVNSSNTSDQDKLH